MSREAGAAAELKAASRLGELGFNISWPVGCLTYDFVAEKDGHCIRVQVKSTKVLDRRKGHDEYRLTCRKGNSRNQRPYASGDFDVLLGYVSKEDTWYIFPFTAIKGTSLTVYPHRSGPVGQYEQFKEAWRLLDSD